MSPFPDRRSDRRPDRRPGWRPEWRPEGRPEARPEGRPERGSRRPGPGASPRSGNRPGGARPGGDRPGGERPFRGERGERAERWERRERGERPFGGARRSGRPESYGRERGERTRELPRRREPERFRRPSPEGPAFPATPRTPFEPPRGEGLPAAESAPHAATAPSDLIWGRHSALATLESGRPIHRIWCTPEMRFSPRFLQLLREAKASGVLVEEVTWARLGQISGGAVHQGIVLQPAAAETLDLTSLLKGCRGLGESPLLIAVDGLTDPQNLGAIVRSAEALGAHGMVLPQRRNAGLTGSVAKVAAGALEHLPVARVVNLNRSLDALKQEGYRVIGLAEQGTVTLEEADLEGPLVVVTGSEGEGLSMLTRRTCDQLVRIPLRGATPSLNASVATALLLFEVARRGWMRGLRGTAPAPRIVRPSLPTAPAASPPAPSAASLEEPEATAVDEGESMVPEAGEPAEVAAAASLEATASEPTGVAAAEAAPGPSEEQGEPESPQEPESRQAPEPLSEPLPEPASEPTAEPEVKGAALPATVSFDLGGWYPPSSFEGDIQL